MVSRWTSVCLSVHPSVRPSVRFSFPDDNLSEHQWIFIKFGMCIDIMEIWFGIANRQISSNFDRVLTELSARDTPIFSFPDDNLSKRQWIFTKLGMCIDIVEIWIGIANRQISSNSDSCLPETRPFFSFPDDNFSKSQGILTKLGTCIDIKEDLVSDC